MTKNEIITRLQKSDSTILSFPDRGPWGESSYRGNCSGWIIASLIYKYGVEKMAELFAGSGTGFDVCRDMGVSYIGADLNPNPKRKGIISINAITEDVPPSFYDADMIFMHPPYGKEIGIPYAGSMYKDPNNELSKYDLGQMNWGDFIKTLNMVVMKYYSALMNGGKMAILMGDVRRNGHMYSMLKDIVQPGELEQIIIKAQHNCVSDGRTYSKRNFYPIVHEYIMVIKKVMPYIIQFSLPIKKSLDIRDSKTATWLDVVTAAVRKLKGKADLQSIYAEIEDYRRCESNPNWKAKVRQTLQKYDIFHSEERGIWQIAC